MNDLNSCCPTNSLGTAVPRTGPAGGLKVFEPGSLRQRTKLNRMMLLVAITMMLLSVFTNRVNAQSTTVCATSVNVANFGADGDLYANHPGTLAGINDDWFFNNIYPGPGIGVIGTSAMTSEPIGLSALDFKALVLASSHRNLTYVQRMAVPKITPRFITATTGYLLLDAVAARDNHTAGASVDSSAFTSGADKNGANPKTWSIGVGGVQQKNDLIDVGGHLRRGYNFATNEAGELWGFAYASTRNTSGDAHTDFEVFRTAPEIVGTSLINTGPDSGHTAGKFFNPATNALLGLSTSNAGDLLVAIDYANGGTNPQASVRIWINPNDVYGDGSNVSIAQYNALPDAPSALFPNGPKPFLFTGVFDGGTDSGPYGYAEIEPKGNAPCLIYSVVNSTTQLGTPWGNLTAQNAAYSDNMEPLVNVSVAINFSAFGLDLNPAQTDCSILFGSLMVKTRSSGSFTSEMKDFVGPFVFGNFAEVFANAGPDQNIGCGVTSATLCPQPLPGISYPPGAIFSWTDCNGNAIPSPDSCITVTSQGCYILTVTHPTLTTCEARDTVYVNGSPDPDPPIVTCPPPSEWNCEDEIPVCPSTIAEFEAAGGTATDISGPLTISCVDGPLVGGECGGTITRTFTITDNCENAATCTQIFTVNDDIPPIIEGPSDLVLGCNPVIPAADTSLATASDNCEHRTLSVLPDVITGTCLKTLTRTYVATDQCNNQATWVQTITYKEDSLAPVITPDGSNNADLGCNPNAGQIDAALGGATASDNCDALVIVNASTGSATNTGGCYWSQTRTFTAVDSCGNNASSASVTVTWKSDTQAPSITANGAGGNLGCNPTPAQIEAALGDASGSDNCDASVTVNSNTGAPVNTGGCYWSVTRTFTATDSCFNDATEVTVTVNYKLDDIAPSITANGTGGYLGCNPTQGQVDAALDGASATDNCDASVIVGASTAAPVNTGGCYWSVTRTFTATDSCGNPATPVQITATYKLDNLAPEITADNGNSALGCNPTQAAIETALGDASATDNCDASVIVGVSTGNPVNTAGCYWSVTRTFTATDSCGNAATSVYVTVTYKIDILEPVITADNNNSALGCNPSQAAIETALGGASASDNCDASVIVGVSTGNPVNTSGCYWSVTRTFTATDSCDNAADPVYVTVTYKLDNLPPVITPSSTPVYLGCNPTQSQINAALGDALASDNCDASVIVNATPGTPVNIGGCYWSQTITFTATDSCGNSADPALVTVTYKLDDIAPVISNPWGGQTVNLGCNPSPNAILPYVNMVNNASATDNCDASVIVNISSSVINNGCYKTTKYVFTAVDSCGNVANPDSLYLIWKEDGIAPVITTTGTDGVNLGCNPTPAQIDAILGSATANDNCDGAVNVTTTTHPAVNTNGCYWSVTRTFSAVDSCGNLAQVLPGITVYYKLDNLPPVIIADKSNSDLGCNPTPGDIDDELGAATASDNCDASVIVGASTGNPVNTTGCYWSVTRTFTATDSCGNAATPVYVTVTYKLDNGKPVITTDNNNSALGCNPSQAAIETALGGATGSDNCDASVIVGASTGNPVNTAGCYWSVTRTFSATDSCGNAANPAYVTVTYKIDTIKPVITPSSTPVYLGCNPTQNQINAALGNALASDNCDASVIVNTTPGTPVNIGGCYWSQTITFTATDSCGNAADPASVTVTYKLDDIAPVIIADKNNADLGCNPTAGAIDYALGDASATDNCDASVIVGVSTGNPVNTTGCYWSVTRTFTATDSCGNAATPVYVTVTYKLDNGKPVITADKSNFDLGCNPSQGLIDSYLGTATATDNCDASVIVGVSTGNPVNTSGCYWSVTRTFSATDSCGNAANPAYVTVTYKIDTIKPVITPSSTPVYLGCNPTQNQINAALGNALASDNCDASVIVNAAPGTPVNIGGCYWSQTITFTATDSCGNAADPASVTVTYKLDDIAPVIIADKNNADLGCNPTAGAIDYALGDASATDNCDATVIVGVSTGNPVNTTGCYWSVTRTFTATDSCGNAATPVYVTVTYKLDNGKPVITADKSNFDLGCNPSQGLIDSYLGTATASDNCDASVIVGVSTGNPVNTSGCYWSVTRTFTATDSCGNAANPVSVTVTYKLDNIKPVITPTRNDANLGCNPSASAINTALGSATATDNCDASVIVHTSTGAPVSTVGCYWTITRTFTATDSCGNAATTRTVTVTFKVDTIKPVITPDHSNAHLGCNPSLAQINTALGSATATDNCDASVIVTVTTTNPVNYSGCYWRQVRTFRAIDTCGNRAANKVVTVTWRVDTIAPVINATGTTLTLGCNPTSAQIAAALGTATATDNCQNVSPRASTGPIVYNGCYRSRTRTWTAVDACGNQAIPVTRTVTWKVDLTKPVVTCNAGGNITICDGGSVDLKPSANDNCDGPLPVTCTRSDGKTNLNDPFPVGVTTVTCTATDECGNTGTCSITVTVLANPTCSIVPPTTLPICGTTGNTLTSNSVNATSYAWSVTTLDPLGMPWIITGGANSPTVTYTGGSGIAIFKLVVTNSLNGVNCKDSCEIMVECRNDRFCTYTQGAYGNPGGTHCDGTTTPTFLAGLLSTDLVIGGGTNKLTLTAADVTSGCLYSRLNSGGASVKLLGVATCSNPVGIVLNGTKFKNTLLIQTITMGLNLRISGSNLGSLHLNGSYLTTYESTGSGCNSIYGTPIPGSGQTYVIPASIITYLGVNNTVNDLYNLANQALAGTYTGTSPSLSQIGTALDRLNNAFDECRVLGGFSSAPPATYRADELIVPEEGQTFSVKAYPNPFTQKASIDFMLNGNGADVTVDVYNLTGTKVATLFNGYAEPDKKYNVELDGAALAPGIYVYHLSTGDAIHTDKLILIK